MRQKHTIDQLSRIIPSVLSKPWFTLPENLKKKSDEVSPYNSEWACPILHGVINFSLGFTDSQDISKKNF